MKLLTSVLFFVFAMLKQVQHDYEINISDQPHGVYLYRVTDETGKLLGEGKFVIEK